ncbi:MAG TPA: hypothetical protein VG323_22265, partial [Thermoanaerobaculia bacterium]|nr:hypothetical protein [Thermoanaerobaculia bacterium]
LACCRMVGREVAIREDDPHAMIILGINAHHADAAACIVVDGKLVAAAMRRLGDNARIRFLFVGAGAQMDVVRDGKAVFAPYQPRETLSESLSAGDAHLVSLQPQLEGLIVPSKFYGILAVARPVIFVGAQDGELARIIREREIGYVVAPGNDAGLVRAIEELAADRARAAAMGRRGRALYDERFAPEIALAEWERILA